MSFTVADEIKIIKYLGYSPNDLPYLRSREYVALQNFGTPIVTEVQSILTKLDALDTLEGTYATDASNALKKADVLEWDTTGRQGNLDKRRSTLVNQLASIFDMQVQSRGGYTRVYKG